MKIKHLVSGVVAEVDDDLGKRLIAESGEWGSARKPRTHTKTPERPVEDSDS